MVKAKVVSIKELTKDNPTLCLSALRVFNKCHQCPQYKKQNRKCKPHIDNKYLNLHNRKEKLQKELKEIDKALKA